MLGPSISHPVKLKENLARDEPFTEQTMAFVLQPQSRIDTSIYEKRNIQCLSEPQFIKHAVDFFSEAKEQIRLGKIAYHRGQYKIAFNLLINANVDEDADAQFMIAQMYAQGKGVAKDRKAADEWYRKATELGHLDAALEAEKSLKREKEKQQREEDELVAEIEAFTKKLLEDD